jgi:hypothetical protein
VSVIAKIVNYSSPSEHLFPTTFTYFAYGGR